MTTLAMGTVALVGAGEFLPSMEPVDRYLLECLQNPRVAIVPTASAPDGDGVPQQWAAMGITHFARLGIRAEAVMLLTREDAHNPGIVSRLADANFIYFSGGKPRFLLETLTGTAAWKTLEQQLRQGATIAGCSAGAMVLGAALFDFPWVWRTLPALGLVSDLAIIPHFDEIPKILVSLMRSARQDVTLAGIDGGTALVLFKRQRLILGKGGVTIMKGKQTRRYLAGEEVES
jgi:cyanophycinase-like exopeptidase